MTFPNFIIAGPPKTGTTSLYSWLSEHPDVCSSSVKETYFLYQADEKLNGVRHFTEEELAEYSSFFNECAGKKVIFEATPSYIYSESALLAISKLPSQPKVLFVLREPAERLYSEYSFHKYKTGRFKGNFEQYSIESRLRESKYLLFIENWVQILGQERVMLLLFDEMIQSTSEVMSRLCKVLNIDSLIYSKDFDFKPKNETVQIRNKKLHQQLVRFRGVLPKKILTFFGPLYFKVFTRSQPTISKDDLNHLNMLKVELAEEIKLVIERYPTLFI